MPAGRGATWVVSFHSLDRNETRRLLIYATDTHDAWNQAEWRLGDLTYVLSVKPLQEVLES